MPSGLVWQIIFESMYPVWGIIGLLVALNYGRAAHADWRNEAGTWGHAILEWAHVAWFIVAGCARDLRHYAVLRRPPAEPPLFGQMGYSPGHLLRFFIMLSFVTSAIFGFMLRYVDRTEWHLPMLLATLIAVVSSMVAGLGHLFIAWRFHPRRWRWTSLGLILAIPVLFWTRVI